MKAPDGYKYCCNPDCPKPQPVPLSEFSHPPSLGRPQWRCRPCVAEYWREKYAADPEQHRAAVRRWQAKNPEKMQEINERYRETHAARLVRRQRRNTGRVYGLTLEEYDAMRANGCAICGTHEGTMGIDHDHDTGKVRDALCNKCNAAIGFLDDDPERVQKAADYLEAHRATRKPRNLTTANYG